MTIPTEPIGSIPRPLKLLDAINRHGSPHPSVEPLYDEAVRETIEQFEATGSPVVTDGEQRKYHNFATASLRQRDIYRWNSLEPRMTAVFHHSATTLRPRGKRRLRRFDRVWRERRWRNKLSMADRLESEDETKQLRSTLLETATSILQIRQRAEQEIRQTNEVLEQRTRELGHALMVLRATLDSTTDAILVTDEKFNLTEFNEKYIDMWKVPRQVLESGMLTRGAGAHKSELR
jgi:PAS domain-containing protein